VVLATPSDGELRRWTFDSVVVPEAFANAFVSDGDGLPIGVFVIEYLAEHTYRVRVIDTATGELGLPLNLRDKSQTVDEVMTAVSRTAVFEPMHQLLFTLYQDATEGGDNLGAFIHTLGLINGVWCLEVPEELGLADHPGALAASPDGTRLYAASSTGGVAGYVVDDITSGDVTMPAARRTARLDASAGRVAIGASNDEVVVALGGRLFRLDPVTLTVRDSFTWDMDIEALTVLPHGSIVIVGTGRMTLVSPHDQILAERILPGLTSDVTRVAVVS
jgi:DNA-binding beta-propeller fold protein YncE